MSEVREVKNIGEAKEGVNKKLLSLSKAILEKSQKEKDLERKEVMQLLSRVYATMAKFPEDEVLLYDEKTGVTIARPKEYNSPYQFVGTIGEYAFGINGKNVQFMSRSHDMEAARRSGPESFYKMARYTLLDVSRTFKSFKVSKIPVFVSCACARSYNDESDVEDAGWYVQKAPDVICETDKAIEARKKEKLLGHKTSRK